MFAVKQVMKKYCEKIKCVHLAYMDLEKSYDRVDIKCDNVTSIAKVCLIEDALGRAVKRFYVKSRL